MNQNSETGHLIFTQWCEDSRALQAVFWRIPIFAMTITGGIGAAILAFDGALELKRLLLIFIGLCNIAFIFMGWRIRKIMEMLLVKIHSFEGLKKPASNFFVLRIFVGIYLIVALFCFWAAIWSPNSWLDKTPSQPSLVVPAFGEKIYEF